MTWRSVLGLADYVALERPGWLRPPSYATGGPVSANPVRKQIMHSVRTLVTSPVGNLLAFAEEGLVSEALEAMGADLGEALAWRKPIDQAAVSGCYLAHVEKNSRAGKAGFINPEFAAIYRQWRPKIQDGTMPSNLVLLAQHLFDVCYWTQRTDELPEFDFSFDFLNPPSTRADG